jgi:TRAP-type C4-dicarboxylate transport system permease small subunit
MKEKYVAAMDVLHRISVFICGVCMVVITVIIPWGVFTRYVLGYGSSWPEPMAVLIMIVLSFLSAAVCYREHLHIAVQALPMWLTGTKRMMLGWFIELCMLATTLFMVWWGTKLVQTTWFQAIAEFPIVSVGLSYLPIPITGAITVLFVIERLWTGALFQEQSIDTMSHVATE